MKAEAAYIPRRLTWIDENLKTREIADSCLLGSFTGPLVILGDPGMGKTELMERLGDEAGCHFIRAVSFLRQSENPALEGTRLVIDGLDEVAALEEGDPLHNVLKKLLAFGRPAFVISCGSAEWQSVTGKMHIADDYGQEPKVVTLEPLSKEDAIYALASHVDLEKA